MVGTSAFTKLVKVDLNSDDNKILKEACNNGELGPEHMQLLDGGNNQTIENSRRISSSSRRVLRGREGSFRNFYLIALFFLFVLSSMILACALKNMILSEDKSDGLTVLSYDGVQKKVTWPDPPPHDDLAAVARYVVHISEWGSLSTNSTHPGIEGYPFVNVFSVSDGPVSNSTGVPYFYLTPMELSVKDLNANNKVSFTVSEAQSDYCNKKGFDPEDPRCAHIILTGSISKVEKDSDEEEFAKLALFSRHNEMEDWPQDHHFFFAKIDIVHIYVLDYFGGAGVVPVEEYFAKNPFA